jgi:GNAT superfamily N-acetyltransferase
VLVRDATPEDAQLLRDVWAAGQDDRDTQTPLSDTRASLARIAADPDQRVLIAQIDEDAAGAVHLVRAPLSPLHNGSAVHVLHLHVLESFRRHGVGHALMEATVSWAEEKDSSHVLAAAAVGSRDANRFMARLGLAQLAVVRGATVGALRAKLPVEPPACARVGPRAHRSVGQVLAARRSMRRAQSRSS